MAVIPPEYLYDSEPLPVVPAGLLPEERTEYLLESHASRGDVIKRDQGQERLMKEWVDKVRQIYPEVRVEEAE